MNPVDRPHDDDIGQLLSAPKSRKRRLTRWIIWSAAALALALPAVYVLTGNRTDSLTHMTEPAVHGGLSVTVTATGNLEPTNQVEVGSELSGTIREVCVSYNDRVQQGQVLVRLDTSKLQAQVLQSKASLESAQAKVLQAQASVKEAKAELARLRHLRELNGKAISPHDLDAGEATLARAVADEANCTAEVSRTRAALDANTTDLAKAVIRSPIDGIVLTRSVEPGQTVVAAMETPVLLTLAEDLSKMKLLVDVDEADVGAVQTGQEAAFSVDAYPGRRFPARITQVRYGATTTNSVVTYKTELRVDNADLALRPGMTATAEITVQRVTDSLLVPNAALRFTPPVPEPQSEAQDEGGLLGKLLPHPPHPPVKKTEASTKAAGGQSVWVLQNGKPAAVPVVAGATDGRYTAVEAEPITAGTPLVVDATSAKP